MDPNELDLVPIDELKSALLRRHDHVIVASLADGVDEVSWAWKGNPHLVVGLIEELKVRMFTRREVEQT